MPTNAAIANPLSLVWQSVFNPELNQISPEIYFCDELSEELSEFFLHPVNSMSKMDKARTE